MKGARPMVVILAALASYGLAVGRWKCGIIRHGMNDPQPGGSHGKPHPTTKILSHSRWRCGRVAARGARAAGYR
jgi:hypothetical protein